MKRYIVEKVALNILNITTLDAQTELGSSKIITNEPLEYKNLPYLSLILTDDQVKLLNLNNIFPQEEAIQENVVLAQNSGYEKLRSFWYKTQKMSFTGRGAKVGNLDTGCMFSVVPYNYAYNFISASTDVTDIYGHGTITSSIIKHPVIAVAPDCEFHFLKVLTDGGGGNESAILAGIDYAIDHELDVVNMSWTVDTVAIRAAVISLAAGNCIVSASAGNNSTETYTVVPACLPGVIAVNAIDINGNPGFRNIITPPGISGAHGITIACNGVGCQSYDKLGNYGGCWGTSCASPFFAGVFAMYKEKLGIQDNKRILAHILEKAKKTQQPQYFGVGTPQF